MMTLSRAKIGMVLIALMALMAVPVSAYCSADWMNRPGTIGHALSLKDGTSVYLDAVVVDKIRARQNPAYVLIRECFDSKSRIVVLTQPLYELSLGQTIDVEGTIITLTDGQRAIVDPIIKGYLDRDGNLLLHGPLIKGLLEPTPWQWKTDMSERSGPPSDDSSPSLPGEPNVSSSTGPRYYSSIANILRLDHSVADGFLVHLQCKPVIATGTDPIYGGYFVIGEDYSRETLKVYCREPASVGDRINKISGQLHYEGIAPVLCVDAGPDYDHQVYVGRADVISNGRSVESGEIRILTDDPPTGSIAYAKTFADTESVTITGKVVSATRTDFPNAIYVQEPDRAGGIRVLFGGSLSNEPVRGDTISVTGTIGTGADIEREIDADTITYVDHPGEPNPLGMPNRILGGSDFNIYTPGVNWPDGSGVGLYNKGLLVKIWGRVTSVDTTNKCFYVDDGTGFDDGSDHIGVKVSWDWPTSGKPSIMPPLADWYVSVTGISGSEDFGSQRTIRVLRPRDQNDVVIYQAGTPIVYDPVDAWQEDFSPSDSSDGGGGSSSADSVDLATGAYNNDPDADIVAVNQVGPDAEFTRLYRSKLAQSGSWSAGLAVGWTHNYDVKVVRDEAGWGDLKLVFPDGAADTLRPVVVGGTPTDAFTPMGPSYLVTGEHSGTPGLWNWIRITFPDETKWEFTSASGSPYRLRKISDIEGNSIYVNRNVDTSISSISTDSSGTSKLLDFSYSSGSLTISDVPSSKSITLSFVAEAGATVLKLVTQVGSSNLKWRYTYESIGSVAYLGQVEAPDPTGEFTYRGHPIYYDSDGRVREIKDANDNSRTYAYGQGYTQVYAKNPSGIVEQCWTQKIGTHKENLGEIDANGQETTIEYNTAKRPWRFTNKNTKQSTATYDDYGNVTQVTDEAGVVTTYGYNDSGSPFRLTSVLTTAGSSSKTSTTFQYYSSGLLQYVNSPKPGTSNTGERVTTEYIYKTSGSGNVWKIITPPGLGTSADQATWTVYEYESDTDYSYSTTEKLGQPIVISVYEGDPANGKLLSRTHLRYDSRGRLEHVIDPLIGSPPDPADYRDRHKVTLAYNDEDQIIDIWYAPTGSNVNNRVHRVYSYDHPGGDLTGIGLYSESGSSFRTIETVPGKVAELKEVLGDILHTNQAYDSLYRLKEVKDFNNRATSFGYDAVGNVSSMRYAGSQTYQWRYDADHNLSKRIDALTRTTNYGYDTTKSYLTSIDYPTGTDASLDYDNFGRLESVTDATGVVSYTYDDNDLVMTVTTDYAGSAPSKTITYAYNQDGSRRSMTVDGVSAGAFVYSYAHNASPGPGLMVTVSNPGIGTPVRCYYNLNGQIIRQTAPRLLTDYTYDNRGLRSSVHNWATLPSPDVTGSRFYDMQYDAAGNLLQASITIPAVGSSNARSGVVYYEYDDNDRLTRERRTISGGSDLYDVYFDYDGADNATQVRDLYFSSYNSNNQINESGYSYDANGNATSYRGFGFAYDYEDLPAEITGGRNGTLSPAFRSDGLRAWRYTSTWGYDCFLYDGDRVVAEFNAEDGSTNWYYNYGPNGLAMRSSASSTYYVYSFDHLGSLVQTFYSGTGDGLAQKTVVYDAFGKLWWDKTSGGSTFTTPDPPGFAGQWGAYTDHETRPSDQNTPLVLMGIRYYDPVTARFVTRDPALGINDYAYCGNNPVGRVDADGEIVETIADVASIGWSTYDLIKNPSWGNLGYLAWDVGATVVPFVPGSYVAKGAKIASRGIKAARATKIAKATTKGRRLAAKVIAHGCFAAGTLVATPSGNKPIESIETGEAVWAFDDTVGHVGLARPAPSDMVDVLDGDLRAVRHTMLCTLEPGTRVCLLGRVYEVSKGQGTGAVALVDTGIVSASVSHTFQHTGDSAVGAIIDVLIRTADGKETLLHATPNHPFYVPNRREYVELGELAPGTPLRTADRQHATIVAMTTRKGTFDVYNLEVGGSHNYYVSDLNVLVHNKAARNTSRLWKMTREATERVVYNPKLKAKIYKHATKKGRNLWWSPDLAGHGGSKWKVFRETDKGLEWYKDADQYGNFIEGKHKGPTGLFIPWKDLRGSNF